MLPPALEQKGPAQQKAAVPLPLSAHLMATSRCRSTRGRSSSIMVPWRQLAAAF